MWKESEFSSKRDDDSAIGDSPNNSAGEESLNSRRKSSTSDEAEEDQAFSHLNAKLGTKVPSCLLQNAEESLRSRVKTNEQNTPNKEPKNKRVIKVMTASPVNTKTNNSNNSRSKIVDSKRNSDTSTTEVFQAKLKHLFFEMKQLRELDSDILRKFVRLNDRIDEMRWHLEQRETDLKRNMEGESVVNVEADVDVTTLARHSPWEEALRRLSEDEGEEEEEDEEDMKFIPPVTMAATSYASLTQARSIRSGLGNNHSGVGVHQKEHPSSTTTTSKSFVNPTYGHIDVKGHVTQGHPSRLQPIAISANAEKQNYYRTKPLRPSSASQTQQRAQSSHNHSQVGMQRSQSASNAAKKYNSLPQHQGRSFHSSESAFRPVNENQVAHHKRAPSNRSFETHNQQDGNRRVSDFQKARDYQNLIDLSRVRGAVSQVSMKPRSRTSTSSLASTVSSASSGSSLRSPTRTNSSRNSSSKWARFGIGKGKGAPGPAEQAQQTKIPNGEDGSTSNNGFLTKRSSLSRRHGDVIARDQNVIAVSYKRRTANDSVYNWIQSQQDDVTYL